MADQLALPTERTQVEPEPVAQLTNSHSPDGGSPRMDGETDEAASMDDAVRLERIESLLEQHQDVVYGYAYRLAGNAAVAEDITQEVYLRAFRSLHNLRETAAARSWLLTIARNEFSRWCKKRKPTTSLENSSEGELPEENEAVGETLEKQEWVTKALSQLTDDYRVVVAMYYFEELSYSEIAAQLKIPIGTVMSRLNRAKKHLKAALATEETES
ncbi:MAG: RNA polymerase sigma factor [Aureliella sp.]